MLLGSDVLLEHESSSSLHSATSDEIDSQIVDSDVIGTEKKVVRVASNPHRYRTVLLDRPAELCTRAMTSLEWPDRSRDYDGVWSQTFRGSAIGLSSTESGKPCA